MMIGKGKAIEDAKLKVTGHKQYVADMKLPGMLYGKIMFSPVAHAKITRLDTYEAETMPGVYAIATFKNTPQIKYNSAKRFIENQVICTETIFTDTVRFVGDRIAAVAAESEALATEALKKIVVEYEDLPVVSTIEDAIKTDAYPIHEGGNIIANMNVGSDDLSDAFAACDYVIDGRYTTPAIHHAAIEPHVAIADWTAEDKLTVYSPNQNCFAYRVILSDIFGLPYSKIRVVAPAIGGAFGGKLEVTIEPVASILSKLSGRPVKIVLTRRESIFGSRVRHASLGYVKTGFMKDGSIKAMDFKIYTNTGAYASSAMNVAGALTHKVLVAYKIKNIHITAIPVYTNTIIAGAMRGYGSPQVYFGMQRQMNKIANILGKDPAEIQRINMVEPDGINPVSGSPIGNPRPLDCLEKAEELMDYKQEMKDTVTAKHDNGRYATGIGMALGIHGNNCFGVHRDNSSPMIKMNEDGSCILITGSHDMGTDTIGMQMQIISDTIGISMDRIDVVAADTDSCLWHIGDYSSRGVFVVGAAAKQSAELMKTELCKEASCLLETEPEKIVLQDNMAWSMDKPTHKVSMRDVMIYCQSVSKRELCVYDTYETPRGANSYGVHMAKVIVDKETGHVKIEKYVAVHDVGFIMNPMMLEGQLHGGIHMGLGYALSEKIDFDENGKPSPLLLKKYGFLKTTEMPEKILTAFIADKGGEPGGPYGAKALGECPVVPVAPAVVNAICNALDIEIDDIPAVPDKIMEALGKQKEEKGEKQ